MHIGANGSLFIGGFGFGLVVAIAGAVVEYWLHLRRGAPPPRHLPGCLLYVMGGLTLAGLVAILASLLFTGSVTTALVLGAGVLIGFYGAFMALFAFWVWVERRKAPQ